MCLCHVNEESLKHVRSRKIVPCVLKFFEFMSKAVVVIAVLELVNTSVKVLDQRGVILKIAAIDALSMVDSKVFWNLLKY